MNTSRTHRLVFAWVLAALLPIFALGPALTSPLEEHAIDTAVFHIYRVVVFSDARAHGAGFFPRWTPTINGDLGGPLFAYTPSLMYFIMDGLHSLGVEFAHTWRGLTALLLVAASLGMFGLALEFTGRADAALVSAASFVYAPHLLRDFFGRGSPQAVGVALFPWVLWLLLLMMKRPSGRRFAGLAGAWGLLLLAHNLSAVILMPVIGLLWLQRVLWIRRNHPDRTRVLWWPVLAFAAGSLLVSFSVIPILAEIDHIQIDNPSAVDYAYPADNPTRLAELLEGPRVLDTGVDNDSLGESLGWLHVLALVITPGLAFYLHRNGRSLTASFLAGMTLLGVLAIWLQTDSASFVWRAIPALDVFQYRFRLLSVISLLSAFSLGTLLSLDRLARWRIPLAALLLIGLIGIQLPALYPELTHRQNDLSGPLTVADVQQRTAAANTASLASFNEYVPVWRRMPFTVEELQRVQAAPIANLPDGAVILAVHRAADRWSLRLSSPVDFTAAFHLLYYPGWTATIDGQRRSIRPAEDFSGYLLLDIPAGEHTVALAYAGTTAQHVGDAISVLTALLLLGVALAWSPGPRIDPAPEPPVYLRPRWSLVIGVLLLAGVKTFYIDPETTLLRHASVCGDVHGVDDYPNLNFDGRYQLCGYDLPRRAYAPGDWLEVTLYWQTDQPQDQLVSSFAHLVGTSFNPATGNPLWGQQDKLLPAGHPAPQWLPDMLYRDRYRFQIPSHTPPGSYLLEIGWYDTAGNRLEPIVGEPAAGVTVSEHDSALLAEITIR